MAVAGFKQDEVKLTQHGTSLHVTGRKIAPEGERQVLHQGITGRSFKQTFSLADHVKVARASLGDGLLSINVVREVPEQLKPRRSRSEQPQLTAIVSQRLPTARILYWT